MRNRKGVFLLLARLLNAKELQVNKVHDGDRSAPR
jgi:hypothetical protein